MRARRSVLAIALALAVASSASAQQRVDRFPDSSPERPRLEVAIPRSSYWIEGLLAGTAVGVVAGLVVTSDAVTCSDGCADTGGPRMIGVTLLGIAGAALGFMIGAAIPRS